MENKATFPFEKDSMEELGDCQIFERMGTRITSELLDQKLLIGDFPHMIYLGP